MPTPINISASRGASILGLSNYRTPVQTWLEIMESREPGFCARRNYELPKFEETPQIRWGRAFESAIIELAERKAGLKIIEREMLFESNGKIFFEELSEFEKKTVNDSFYITCHIDGKYNGGEYSLHEGKTTSAFYYYDNFGEPGTDKVSQEYQIQCQHQLICTGADKVILSVLVFPRRVDEWEEMGIIPEYHESGDMWDLNVNNCKNWYHPHKWATFLNQMGYFHQYEINAHPELQQKMIKHYMEFWNKYVLTGKEPEPQTYDDIKCLVRNPIGTILADETVERLMSEYDNIKSEISGSGPLAKRAEQIKISVLDYMHKIGGIQDEESADKYILRSQDGKKLASYGKNKNGVFIFR